MHGTPGTELRGYLITAVFTTRAAATERPPEKRDSIINSTSITLVMICATTQWCQGCLANLLSESRRHTHRYRMVVVQDVSGAAPGSQLYLLDREDPQRGFLSVVRGIDAFISAAFHRD